MPVPPIAFRSLHADASLQVDQKKHRPAEFTRSIEAATPADGNLRTAMNRLRGISTPLQEAVHSGGKLGDYQQIAHRLEGNPGAAGIRSRFHQNTLLHEACLHWTGNPDQHLLINALAKHGVDVNAKNSRGETALDIAVKKLSPGQGETLQGKAVKELLGHQANVTPGVVRQSEELARQGDPWLRQAIAGQRPIDVRL